MDGVLEIWNVVSAKILFFENRFFHDPWCTEWKTNDFWAKNNFQIIQKSNLPQRIMVRAIAL